MFKAVITQHAIVQLFHLCFLFLTRWNIPGFCNGALARSHESRDCGSVTSTTRCPVKAEGRFGFDAPVAVAPDLELRCHRVMKVHAVCVFIDAAHRYLFWQVV